MKNLPTVLERTCSNLVGVMSLCTGVNKFSLNRESFMLTTLAIRRNQDAFRKLMFYTDDKGYEIGRALGWDVDFGYLREIEDRETWALCKFHALLATSDPCAHVDNDAMFIKPDALFRLEKAALFAQSYDKPEYYDSPDMRIALAVCEFQERKHAYNCGLLGGSNIDLLHTYCRRALLLAKRFEGTGINGTTASMVVEQYHLGRFAEMTATHVAKLLPQKPTLEEVDRAGWIHLHGKAKFDIDNVNRVEKRLASDYPDVWERFNRGWFELSNQQAPVTVAA